MKGLEVRDGEIVVPEQISFATLNGLMRMGYSLHIKVMKGDLSGKPFVLTRPVRPQMKQPKIKF
jgi:hypothetical protein